MNATEETPSESRMVPSRVPPSTFQTLTDLSRLADAISRASGEKASALTGPELARDRSRRIPSPEELSGHRTKPRMAASTPPPAAAAISRIFRPSWLFGHNISFQSRDTAGTVSRGEAGAAGAVAWAGRDSVSRLRNGSTTTAVSLFSVRAAGFGLAPAAAVSRLGGDDRGVCGAIASIDLMRR